MYLEQELKRRLTVHLHLTSEYGNTAEIRFGLLWTLGGDFPINYHADTSVCGCATTVIHNSSCSHPAHTTLPADLVVEFGSHSHEEVHVELIMVGDEGFG